MSRTLGPLALVALGAIGLQWASTASSQQTFPSYLDVDFFYSQQPAVFRQLWQSAQTRTIRIAVIGDSQETSPNSHGFQYIPRLNYEMWRRYGNSPETPVVGCFFYGTTPPAHWLLSGVCSSPGPTATRLDASQILPNARPRAISTLDSSANITGGSRGQLTMLRHDASGVDPSAAIPTDVSYFNTSGTVRARIFAATHPTSGEIAYHARPNAIASPSYSAAVTTTGTLNLGLQSSTFAIKSGMTRALSFNGLPYMALEVFGSSDAALTDLIGLRFVNDTHPEGVVIDTFSLGGYTAARFLNAHADAGAMFAAFGFHAAIIHFGANEGGSVTAAQFQSNLSAVISRLRTWVRDPNFPIILIADVYQSRLTPDEMAIYDQYVGAQLAIAQADPNVMIINARRLTENIGWNAISGQATRYLEDGVHYTGLGAQSLAAAVVSAMMGEIDTSGCPSDPGAVALQSDMTLVVELAGTSACTNHGQFAVARSLTLNQPALEVRLAHGFTPAAGDKFKILSAATIVGSFGAAALPTLPSGLSWNTTELYTTGTLGVEAPPPPLPAAPTITVTSGGNQSVTSPQSPSSVGFSLTGSGSLTVTASSSNTTLLPSSGISIGDGCGTQTLTCTMSLVPASGQTGSSTVSLTVADAHDQTATATTTLTVNAQPDPGPGAGTDTGNGRNNGKPRGGGGSLDVLSLLQLMGAAVGVIGRLRPRTEHQTNIAH